MNWFVLFLFTKFIFFLILIIHQEHLVFDISPTGIENLIFYFKAPCIILSAELVVVNLALSLIRLHILNTNAQLSKNTLNINKFNLIYGHFENCIKNIAAQYGDEIIKDKSMLWKTLIDDKTKKGEYNIAKMGLGEQAQEWGDTAIAAIKKQLDTFIDFREDFKDIIIDFKNSDSNN